MSEYSKPTFTIARLWQRVADLPWLAEFLALLGLVAYLTQALVNAHSRTSFLDEGLFLYKGWAFVTGRLDLFADNNAWSNHMPLAFLIPGGAQALFGPGLQTGRYFAIFLSLLTLIGLWIVTRRLAGRWWAAGVVWALALNIASIKLYTLAMSEGIVACLFAWTLVCLLGKDRPTWQIIAGGILSAAIALTRINLTPVMALVVLYVFWQHGPLKGWICLAATGGTFLLVQLVYWPEILKLWAAWLPRSLTPFLNGWRMLNPGERWTTDARLADNLERLLYFFLSYRLHFISLGGALMVWVLWPGGVKQWKTPEQFRIAVFLSVTLLLLMAMHVLAAFFLGFCISCLLLYITFFDFLGLVLLAQSFSAIKLRQPLWREVLGLCVFVFMAFGLAYSAYGEITQAWIRQSAKWIGWNIQKHLLWGQLLRRGMSNFGVYQVRVAEYAMALILGVLLLLSILILILVNRQRLKKVGINYVLWSLTLALALLFSPSIFLSRGNDFFNCTGDVIRSYEATGAALRSAIPPDSQVFWVGRLPALFLYLPDVIIFPPQLNHFHNYRTGGDDQELSRFGLWSPSIAQGWFDQADYVLVEDAWLKDWVADLVASSQLQELPSPPLPEPCRNESLIHIYKK